jgi:hypothetical protein
MNHTVDYYESYDEEFTVWCNYHYSTCREKSIFGASSHGIVMGRKKS